MIHSSRLHPNSFGGWVLPNKPHAESIGTYLFFLPLESGSGQCGQAILGLEGLSLSNEKLTGFAPGLILFSFTNIWRAY